VGAYLFLKRIRNPLFIGGTDHGRSLTKQKVKLEE